MIMYFISKNLFSKEWKDELLTWDPNEFDNISLIKVPYDKLWIPGNLNSLIFE